MSRVLEESQHDEVYRCHVTIARVPGSYVSFSPGSSLTRVFRAFTDFVVGASFVLSGKFLGARPELFGGFRRRAWLLASIRYGHFLVTST